MELSPDILRRAQGGDSLAQAEFIRRAVGPVRALIRRIGSPADREDQLQEALSHLLRVLPQFTLDGPAQLGTWVHTIVYRWLLMQRRRRHLEVVPLESAALVADRAPSAEQQVADRQRHLLLSRALERLPEAQRRIFVLTQLHQFPMQEVADAEGISLGTVKSRLHRARAELVELLGDALDEEQDSNGGTHAVHR